MENKLNIQVLREGEPDPDFMPPEPTALEAAGQAIKAKLGQVTSAVALQAEVITYDIVHNTNYYRIRRDLIREKREAEHLKKIGLVSLSKGMTTH